MADAFAEFPEYIPDIDNYVAPHCSFLSADDLSPYLCSIALSILMLNIRSCKKNFDNFLSNFCNCINSFSCIILTETWLTEDRDKIFDIPGYYCCNLYRNQYGGGIKVFLKNCIQSRILSNFTVLNNLLEMLTIELIYCGCKFLLMTVYHPPSSCSIKNVDFVDSLSTFLNNALELNLPLIMAGDMNLNLLNPCNNFYIDMYLNNLFECNMKPLITRPTKVNLNNPITRFAVLDQIWVSESLTSAQSFIIPIGITDHFPVCSVITSAFHSITSSKVKSRYITRRGKETFSILLSNISMSMDHDMNHCYDHYHNQIFKIYDTAFPLVTRKVRGNHPVPWMSFRLKQCIKKKAKLYRLYLRGSITKADYTVYKNRLTNVIRKSKALYYSKLFLENAGNPKMVWSTINNVLNRKANSVLKEVKHNGVVMKGEVLANFANDYFVNIANSITTSLTASRPFTCFSPPVLISCFFYPTCVNEVIKVINKLKNKGSKILDLHPSILKENVLVFSNHFVILYNMSVLKRVFPNSMKIARVNPAFKSGQQDQIDNYRPISSLPLFSKVFEKLTLIRMEKFISQHHILTPYQFGFRQGCSISHAVIKLLTHVVQAYHEKNYCACFFLDLRKAFDTVNHNLLIRKLDHYGFRGHFSDYMKSYFDNRKQFVQVDGCSSSLRSVTCGVPQGSILGPICFSLYINDMPLAVKEKVVLFADDAAFVIICHSLDGLYRKIRALFSDLSSYLNINKLVPNSRKSKLMMIKSRLTPVLPDLYFSGERIEWVSEFKYLGITLSRNMTFCNHINNVSLRISRMTGTFTCLRAIMPRNILIKLYYALVYPHLSGHIVIWGSSPPSHLKQLTVRLNTLLRTILGVEWVNGRPQTGNNELYSQLGLLKLNSIYKLNLFKLLRLLLDGELPEFWELLLASHLTPHAYNTRGIRFRHPNIVCEVERRALSYQLILMLEELSPSMLEISFKASIKQFKKSLLTGQ